MAEQLSAKTYEQDIDRVWAQRDALAQESETNFEDNLVQPTSEQTNE